MKSVPLGYWLLLAVTLGSFAAMVFWTLPAIRAEAGGLRAFDLRLTGYRFEEAQAFLAALSERGRAIYGGAQSILDAIFPPMFFATVAIAIWHFSGGIRKETRYAIIAVAAIGMAADSFENAAIRDMLIAGAEGIDREMVDWASLLTVTKAAAHTVALLALGFLILRHLRQRAKPG